MLYQVALTEEEIGKIFANKSQQQNASTTAGNPHQQQAKSRSVPKASKQRETGTTPSASRYPEQESTSTSFSSSNNGSPQRLTREECNGIFAAFSSKPEQIWHVGKKMNDSRAKCSGCKASQMVNGRLYMTVDGLFIPQNQNFAKERKFYFCANVNCTSKKPYMSNLEVPPKEVYAEPALSKDDIELLAYRGFNVIHD